jgi:hypothetical protein
LGVDDGGSDGLVSSITSQKNNISNKYDKEIVVYLHKKKFEQRKSTLLKRVFWKWRKTQ